MELCPNFEAAILSEKFWDEMEFCKSIPAEVQIIAFAEDLKHDQANMASSKIDDKVNRSFVFIN
jgi:hypothetical protein